MLPRVCQSVCRPRTRVFVYAVCACVPRARLYMCVCGVCVHVLHNVCACTYACVHIIICVSGFNGCPFF